MLFSSLPLSGNIVNLVPIAVTGVLSLIHPIVPSPPVFHLPQATQCFLRWRWPSCSLSMSGLTHRRWTSPLPVPVSPASIGPCQKRRWFVCVFLDGLCSRVQLWRGGPYTVPSAWGRWQFGESVVFQLFPYLFTLRNTLSAQTSDA